MNSDMGPYVEGDLKENSRTVGKVNRNEEKPIRKCT
jgi:hypothetical protein